MFQCKHTIIQNTIVHDQCDVLNKIISRIVNTFFDVLRKIKKWYDGDNYTGLILFQFWLKKASLVFPEPKTSGKIKLRALKFKFDALITRPGIQKGFGIIWHLWRILSTRKLIFIMIKKQTSFIVCRSIGFFTML